MVDFSRFSPEGNLPIYVQVLEYFKRGIVSGDVRDGDELPSRRVLSALLGINPNTAQKVYRLLEEEGLICSHPGAKSFVTLKGDGAARIRKELLEKQIRDAAAALKQLGLSREEALTLLDRFWE